MFLRATTKGLIVATQELEFVVCPEGGASIYPPMSPIYAAVDVGSSGTNANAIFLPFTGEQVEGCAGGW